MARLKVEINVQDWSGDMLRQAVVDIDKANDPDPIDFDKVGAMDILWLICNGELGVSYTIEEDVISG